MRGIYQDAKRSKRKARRGFTIVELLIVVVVIAILAAITVVAYNSITVSAKESALKSDLSSAAKRLNVEKVQGDGVFPAERPVYISANLSYAGGGDTFCLTGQANDTYFHIKDSGGVESGKCPYTPPQGSMQAFTSGHCSALTTYTGSNPAAIINLTDSRGGTTRTYQVARLADGKCWMLENLRLGLPTSTVTLTAQDSDVDSEFTLPPVLPTGVHDTSTSPGNNYDTPYAYGPVPGDTNIGQTNYGYLYNWSAASAGESRVTKPAGGGDAQFSICAANWNLPSAADFSWLNAKMNDPSAASGSTSTDAGFRENWTYTGPFKGVLSGHWRSSFGVFAFQGSFDNGNMWSRSSYASDERYAYSARGASVLGNIGIYGYRYDGYAVRCTLS